MAREARTEKTFFNQCKIPVSSKGCQVLESRCSPPKHNKFKFRRKLKHTHLAHKTQIPVLWPKWLCGNKLGNPVPSSSPFLVSNRVLSRWMLRRKGRRGQSRKSLRKLQMCTYDKKKGKCILSTFNNYKKNLGCTTLQSVHCRTSQDL